MYSLSEIAAVIGVAIALLLATGTTAEVSILGILIILFIIGIIKYWEMSWPKRNRESTIKMAMGKAEDEKKLGANK